MKRYIRCNDEDNYGYYFRVYELEDGEEIDYFEEFKSLEDAIEFADNLDISAHVVMIPNFDPDDDPYFEEWLEDNCEYEPYEVVYENNLV